MLLDIIRDKILFMLKRCQHDNNIVSIATKLLFFSSRRQSLDVQALAITNLEYLSSVEISSSHFFLLSFKLTILHRTTKDTLVKRFNSVADELEYLNIVEISAEFFFMSAKNKNNKLFLLTLNEIISQSQLESRKILRVSRNNLYSYEFEYKYKKCCDSNVKIEVTIEISKTTNLNQNEIKRRLPEKYYDFINVFDRDKVNILPLYRLYNYRVKFAENINEIKLLKSRIYSILDYKLEQIKKYLNKNLKKEFIILSKVLFALLILFAKKSNDELRFCVNYRKLNQITKRNRYFIPLIDEVLARVQGYKFITRLDIIAAFNKLRIYPDSEEYTTFITSLKAYKYRVLLFDLTNKLFTY